MHTKKQSDKIKHYMLSIAKIVATRSTCSRAHVGAVLVNENNEILATGYNGSPRGIKHCDDSKHIMYDSHCIATVHAELNAILSAAKNGVSIKNAVLFSTHHPCFRCMQTLINAGIKKVFYSNDYYDSHQHLYSNNVECMHIKEVT